MSEQNNISINTLEDAWKLAKEKGYEGTFEEFKALGEKIENDPEFNKMDLDSMETVAGGGFVSAMEAVGEWCKDHKELLMATTGTLAVGVTAYLTYRYTTGGNTTTGDNISVMSDPLNTGFML